MAILVDGSVLRTGRNHSKRVVHVVQILLKLT